jgi:hypothetical protein
MFVRNLTILGAVLIAAPAFAGSSHITPATPNTPNIGKEETFPILEWNTIVAHQINIKTESATATASSAGTKRASSSTSISVGIPNGR